MTSRSKIIELDYKRIDFQKRQFRKAEFLGRKALFTELRLDREIVPNGVAAYDLREGVGAEHNKYGDPLPPSLSIALSVVLNRFGTILVAERFESVEYGEQEINENNWGFGSTEVSLPEGIAWLKNKEPFDAND